MKFISSRKELIVLDHVSAIVPVWHMGNYGGVNVVMNSGWSLHLYQEQDDEKIVKALEEHLFYKEERENRQH